MRNSGVLDSLDMRILDLLEQTPEITQTRLARELKVSQPWVATRLKLLKQKGVLTVKTGINFERLGLVIGAIGLSSKNPYHLARKYRSCPYFLRGLILSGEQNLALDFFGEDTSSLQGIVDQHIRKEPEVANVDFRLVTHVIGDLACCPRFVFPTKEESPCGASCIDCIQYESSSCVGCPASVYYRGKFWNFKKYQRAVEAQPLP